jgi:hypothetical protein
MEPGDVYLKGDGYRAIIAHVFGDMIVIINQEIDSGLWVDREEPYRLSLFCDLDSECWAEKFEQQPGESWEQAVARAVATFHAESGSVESRYELGSEAFAMGGMSAYNEVMGYGVVQDPDDY